MLKNSKWIAVNIRDNDNGSFLFRKEFILDRPVLEAKLYVIGLGYGVYYFNGKKVTEDVLITPFTKFDARVLYTQYDVTELLNQGDNVIGAFVGNGWYNCVGETWNYEKASWRHHPKLILQLDIKFCDQTETIIRSDSTWKADKGPAIYNHVREGELYDARLEQDGWNRAGFDETNWVNTYVCRAPGGVIEPSDIPPIRIIRSLTPTYLGNQIYDFGENISGWVKMKGKWNSGDEIVFTYAELYKDNDIVNENINHFNHHLLKHSDKYIFKGGTLEEWEPHFVYHGFRYVKVTGAPDNLELTAQVVHTDLETVGSFSCSDDMLNKIHDASCRATLTNFHSIPTDCPHREQNGWTGDALLSAEQALMNFDMTKAYRKWLNDFKDVQRPSGQLPGIIPTSNWGYNWGSGPAWDSSLILIPWHIYMNTGDSSVIRLMWPNMKLYIDYMNSMAENYIVNYGLGDWCPPSGAAVCPAEVTDTAYYYVNAKTMAECARLFGEDNTSYLELAKKIRAAFREKYLEDKQLMESQTFLACCIYQGLVEEEEAVDMAKALADLVRKHDYHIDCGILGTKYIFSALSNHGYGDVLYKMVVNPTMPSYAYWINSGMTTLCEDWDMSNSCNHHMFSEVDHWFYKHIAGIQLAADKLVINPSFLTNLKWVKAKHRDISVEWDEDRVIVAVPQKAEIIIGDTKYSVEPGKHELKKNLN